MSVRQPYTRQQQRTSIDEDVLLDCRVNCAVSDPVSLQGEAGQDATASPAAAGVLGRFASLSAAAISSSLPLLRGFSGGAAAAAKPDSARASLDSKSSSDTAQQQQQQRDQATHREVMASQDAAATTVLLSGDSDVTQAASRRYAPGAAATPREPQHLISAAGGSDVSCKLQETPFAGNAAADLAAADVAPRAGYMDAAAPAGSLGVPGARLLLATAVGAGKGTYKSKSDKGAKKSV
ncbi:hypothetical protein OEZ85_014451 [Tetradesmus obliquus]|uniref:Uncharacterized protein n=1 Tax=Tetradesmus obliquus TaxID=3088 RepID=A0ABY8UB26_TETOB|nr:hypothetical protein OEZ85_014451 [Tetradesmus obliquus]